MTSVNRARRNERDEDDNINYVNSNDAGQEQQMTRRSLAKGNEREYSSIQAMKTMKTMMRVSESKSKSQHGRMKSGRRRMRSPS